jgi:CspA family cold shock protein
MSEALEQGVVSYVNEEKGFGFITVEGREKDLFFHSKDLKNVDFESIKKGSKVSFEFVEESPKGFSAKGVYLD